MKSNDLLVLFAVIFLFTAPAQAAMIATVPVGNPGNSDGDRGIGAVPYAYRIGKYEVTNVQYVEFLNGVDPTGANELAFYNGSMSSDARGGINFNGTAADGSKFEIKSGRDNNPVVFVSWYDSVRFANWLHNGQGNGDTESGAYMLGQLGANGIPLNSRDVIRNPGARWWLPNQKEWNKAAYHKNDGVTGNYWNYPTSTDARPFSDEPPGSDAPTQSNTANFAKDDLIANGYDDGYAVFTSAPFNSQNYLTNVGAYTLSVSPYDTYDQGGNVFEWNETLGPAATRGFSGGSWADNSINLSQSGQGGRPQEENFKLGFRVASIAVPEPSTLLLGVLPSVGMLLRRRR